MVNRRVKLCGLVAASLVLVSGGCGGGDEREPKAFDRGSWQQFQPGRMTRCARGDPYSFWLRRGDPKKVLVFFQGGGACDDAESCRFGGPFRDSVVADANPAVSGRGVLDVNDARNLFRDWSFLYVSYCTGDLNTGDARIDYGDVVIEHRGRRNARAALDRAFREYPRPGWNREGVVSRLAGAYPDTVVARSACS